jgi:hypothetical protein
MGAEMRRIHVGNALSTFGLGFTVPYLYVYVAQVRDLGAVTAGLVLTVFAVAALVVLPSAGARCRCCSPPWSLAPSVR